MYQWVLDRVKPERDNNRDKDIRERWWQFGRVRTEYRELTRGLLRYITTVETSKHRFFQFLDATVRPDNMLVNIGIDDAFFLGVLSSRMHVAWALAAGGRLGVGNDPRYNKTRCFDPFPFPDPSKRLKTRIRKLGEKLDAHRKEALEKHSQLTMTGLYNVLKKVRAGEALSDADKDVYDAGLVGILRKIHDDIDAAVAEAYGWPVDISDEEILERLVALNHERAAEEEQGHIRWLRPEFQNPDGPQPAQKKLDIGADEKKPTKKKGAKLKKQAWPSSLPERFGLVSKALADHAGPAEPAAIAKRFTRARKDAVEEILDSLVTVGQARQTDDGRYVV